MGRHPWIFFEHQPCLLLKRYETWFIYSDQLVDFHKTNQPDGSTSIQGIMNLKNWNNGAFGFTNKVVNPQLPRSSNLPFCTFPTDTTPHFSKKSPEDVWQVCTTVLDFCLPRTLTKKLHTRISKGIRLPKPPSYLRSEDEWRWLERWIGSILEIFKMF